MGSHIFKFCIDIKYLQVHNKLVSEIFMIITMVISKAFVEAFCIRYLVELMLFYSK